MGIVASCFDIIQQVGFEKTETTHPDGTITKMTRTHPLVAGMTVAGMTAIVVFYLDGGKGAFTKVFGKND